MNYLQSIGRNAKKAFEDLKNIKHKKIKKVLENYNQSLLKNTNKIIRENLKEYNHGWRYLALPQWLINGLYQALLKLQDYHQYIPRQLHKDLPIVLI